MDPMDIWPTAIIPVSLKLTEICSILISTCFPYLKTSILLLAWADSIFYITLSILLSISLLTLYILLISTISLLHTIKIHYECLVISNPHKMSVWSHRTPDFRTLYPSYLCNIDIEDAQFLFTLFPLSCLP